MDKINTYFFELLQVALGNKKQMTDAPSEDEWMKVVLLCRDQAMMGMGYVGFTKLPDEQKPKVKMTFAQWAIWAERFKYESELVSKDCAKITRLLADAGFHSCILKGQSNLHYYGEISSYRTSGDIDVWAWTDDGKIKNVVEYVKSHDKDAFVTYHHADCALIGETDTEVHHRPSWMSSPWRNRTLQRFSEMHKSDVQEWEGFYVPSADFDAVYQIVHIYRHLFYEGIGIKQIVDYYMVLQSLDAQQRKATMRWLDKLDMRRFTGAVMWVMMEVLAKDGGKEWLLCEPDKDAGAFLLDEIMMAGNLGQADTRIKVHKEDNRAKWGLMKLKRNMRFLRYYPEEVICEPLFRLYHWVWRTFKLWRWE